MLYSEFTKLAGFEVKESYYHKYIEPEYDESNLDKAEWVKQWKKNGGIQKAYDNLLSSYVQVNEMNQNQAQVIREERETLFNLRQVVEAANNEAKDYREKFEEVKEQLFDANATVDVFKRKDNEMAYTLLEISEKYSCAELREIVIKKIGFRAYIQYKFDHDMCIWQLDRDEIMKHI